MKFADGNTPHNNKVCLISFSRNELFNMRKEKETVFEAVTKDAATLAALLGSRPVTFVEL